MGTTISEYKSISPTTRNQAPTLRCSKEQTQEEERNKKIYSKSNQSKSESSPRGEFRAHKGFQRDPTKKASLWTTQAWTWFTNHQRKGWEVTKVKETHRLPERIRIRTMCRVQCPTWAKLRRNAWERAKITERITKTCREAKSLISNR